MSFGFEWELDDEPRQTADTLPKCGSCGLLNTCHSPKMRVAGKGRLGIMIVGEAPGRTEDREDKPFVGVSGQDLQRTLEQSGYDLFRDCWVTNALICRPPDNRTPTDKEINYCRPNLLKTIRKYQPHTIILLGAVACKSLLGHLEQEKAGAISTWAGFDIPCQELNAWICPTYHPAYIRYEKSPVAKLWFDRHINTAMQHRSPPWQEIPNYEEQVSLVFDVHRAAVILDKMEQKGGLVAFDFEANMLKPDGDDATIVCCSVSWEGERTIVFPWQGVAVEAMRRLLRSPHVKKIGANIKYEERWIQRKLRTTTKGWVWDVTQAAHVIDSRPGITGVGFQSFALLGVPNYYKRIEPYLVSDGARVPNRILDADGMQLMTYCGIDAIVEFDLALIQAKLLGISL